VCAPVAAAAAVNWGPKIIGSCVLAGLVFSHANYYLHRGQPSFLISKCVTHSHMASGVFAQTFGEGPANPGVCWLATNNSQIWERIICSVSNMAFCNLRSCIWPLENSSRPEVLLRVSLVWKYYGNIPAQHRHLLHQQSAGPGSICHATELQGPSGNRSQLGFHGLLGHFHGGDG